MASKSAVRTAKARGGRIVVGVGGWSFAPWRGTFYPRGLAQAGELAFMSAQLTSIEINSTFYRVPAASTWQRWHDETPAEFVFATKAPMFVANRSDLATAGAGIHRFLDSSLLRLGSKLGPINWQLPPTKRFVATELEAFFSLLPAKSGGHSLRHAIEVRHESFLVPRFVELARRFGVAIVTAGDSRYPQIADATAPFAYLRIMGTTAASPNGYATAGITRWAQRAKALAGGQSAAGLDLVAGRAASPAGARDVFLYVISGEKARNPLAAAALLERLRR